MSTTTLRPWTDLVELHSGVESGTLADAVFAIDLDAIAACDPNVPVVSCLAPKNSRAAHLSTDPRAMLEVVLASPAVKGLTSSSGRSG